MKVAIINYGMGNLRSVMNAFHWLGQDTYVAIKPGDLRDADSVVLPGVGAFGDAMKNLDDAGWTESLHREVITGGKPFLGICLGMQILASTGTEHGCHKGLGWIPGRVLRLQSENSNLRVPHIGWNDVNLKKKDGLYQGLGDRQSFYFVHSYAMMPEDQETISGTCEYGPEFVASVEKDNIFAIQFHPEKSHKAGLAVLKNFINAKA